MNAFPAPKSVLVMDNCNVHNDAVFRDILEKAGILVVYLPPYSPYLNPIEHVFSKVKSHIRRVGYYDRVTPISTILDNAFAQVTAEDCRHYVLNCGYML